MHKKIKSLLPSLKEKKRYLAYKITTKEGKVYQKNTAQEIALKIANNLGAFDASEAGLIPIECSQEKSSGIIRISNKHIYKAKAALALITEIGSQKAIVSSTSASGMLNKARNAQ